MPMSKPDTLQFSCAVTFADAAPIVSGSFQMRTAEDVDIAVQILGHLRAYLAREPIKDVSAAKETPDDPTP